MEAEAATTHCLKAPWHDAGLNKLRHFVHILEYFKLKACLVGLQMHLILYTRGEMTVDNIFQSKSIF